MCSQLQIEKDRKNSVISRERSQEILLSMTKLVGRKWYPVILHHLLIRGPAGFTELKDEIDGISGKMLSNSLDELEEEYDLVERTILNDKPIRVEYSLTDRGEKLGSIIIQMREWGAEYLSIEAEGSFSVTDH
ncbi:MAG: winged helix-turn-helix transcriptional regulator [Halobacteriaceae archaeon]